MKRIVILVMVFSFAFSFNGLVLADDASSRKPSVGDVLGDVLCIRPLGFIEIAFNSLFFVISLPVTIPLKKTDDAKEFFITEPYHFYFNRGLGEPLGRM